MFVTFSTLPASNDMKPETPMTYAHPVRTDPSAEPPLLPDPAMLALVHSAGGGDAQAFKTIMRLHNRLLFRTARSIVPDDAQAQDVVQETYLRAFTHLQSFRGESRLGTWLARIAIRVALEVRRRQGHFVQLADGWDSSDMTSTEVDMLQHLSRPESPDAAAERGELRAVLQSAIEHLPVIYRSVFMLRAVEAMSVEEVATCLGVSAAVVKTRFLRARAMLRHTLAEQIENHAADTFAFAGARCDAVVGQVLRRLQDAGLLRLR